jgi:hypothetical protein
MKNAMRPHPHPDSADSFAVRAGTGTSPGGLFVIS